MDYRKALGTAIIMMIVGLFPIVFSVIITLIVNSSDIETYTVTLSYIAGAALCIPVADKGLNIKFKEHIRKPEVRIIIPMMLSAIFYEIFSIYTVYHDSLESAANQGNGALTTADVFSVIGLIAISPVSEEVIFRFAMLTVLIVSSSGNRVKSFVSILITSLLWIIPHFSPSIIRSADILVVGLIIGTIYLFGKNIIYGIIFHSTLNSVVALYALSGSFRKLLFEHSSIAYVSLGLSVVCMTIMFMSLFRERKNYSFQQAETLNEISSKQNST